MRLLAAAAVLAGFLCACGPFQNSQYETADLRPPAVEGVRTIATDQIELSFDEEASVPPEKLHLDPELAVREISAASARVIVSVSPQEPGRQYTLEATAQDSRGNSVTFQAEFYGYNPRVPSMLINEVRPRGSVAHPDCVEIKIFTDGDMGGVTVYAGTPGSFDDRFVFPSFGVKKGDFILVHYVASLLPEERDEGADKASSSGVEASAAAFDIWRECKKGLGSNNGVISLYDRPGGSILDGFLYSNRTSASDERFGGFGSAQILARAEELVSAGGWKTAGEHVTPEDAFNPEGSTATRTICRSGNSADTDTREDWHIVPAKKATLGAENSDEKYTS